MAGQIIFNQMNDGPTGHLNLTFINSSGTSLGTWGANILDDGNSLNGFEGGVRPENNTGRVVISQTAISVTDAQFDAAWSYVQSVYARTVMGQADYELVCGNCVDFAASVLETAGENKFSIQDYLVDGTLLDIYANSVMYLCKPYQDEVMADIVPFSLPDYMWNYSFPYMPQTFATSEFVLQLFTDVAKKMQCSKWDMYVDYLNDQYSQGESPIIIDLNGDGVHTLSLAASKVAFDLTGDGVKEHTAWVDKHDGFLVIDKDGNQLINDIAEMFGGEMRGEGFAKLTELDSNGDGVLDRTDAAFAELKIWKDANSNGETENGELKELSHYKITALALDYVSQNIYETGNLFGEVGTATIKGEMTEIIDVYFKYLTSEQASILQTLWEKANQNTSDLQEDSVHRAAEQVILIGQPNLEEYALQYS